MKKLILMFSFLASMAMQACTNNANDNNAGDERNSPENVDRHSEEEITPQVSAEGDSTLLNVDTVSSAESAEERKRDSI